MTIPPAFRCTFTMQTVRASAPMRPRASKRSATAPLFPVQPRIPVHTCADATEETSTQALRTKWSPEFGARLVVREPRADVTEAQLLRVHSLAHTARVELAP